MACLDDLDFAGARPYAIPMTTRFRGITVREGMLIEGPAGWGEFCPFREYDDHTAATWLATAVEQATRPFPTPRRHRVPVNRTIPAVPPARAHRIAAARPGATVKVKVADHQASLPEDVARVEAVRDGLGTHGRIRVDANGAWTVDKAVTAIRRLDAAAGGLEYVEQPCGGIDDLAAARRAVNVPIAADESIRRADDPLRVALAGAADIAVVKVAPLGGVRRALRIAEAAGIPCVVSSALETSVGLAAQLALAACLPSLDHACGLGTLDLLTGDLVAGGRSLRATGDTLTVPDAPPEPDPALLEAYRPAPERAAWWADRLARARDVLAANPGLCPR